MDTGSLRGAGMRLLIEVIALLVIGAIVVSIAIVILGRNPLQLAQGELRCEGGGAIIINVGGKDYAVNGMAGPRYPPIQSLWSKSSYPETDIDRLIVRGLTLCEW
jgi:hypothetical protein